MSSAPIDRIVALLPLLKDEDLDQLAAAVQLLVNKRPARPDQYMAGVFDTLTAIRQFVLLAIQDAVLHPLHTAVMMALVDSVEEDMREGVEAERAIGLSNMQVPN